jgi:LacI family transcriptional regulator
MSLGVLLEIVRSGLKIPADMAVASFGEVEAGPLLRESGLYYMEQHPYDMGIKAGEILLSRIREEAPLSEPEIEIYSNEVKQLN